MFMAIQSGYLNKDWISGAGILLGGSVLNMPKPYLQPKEMLGLQRTFSLYSTLHLKDFKKIERAEKFDNIGDKIFKNLSDEFYLKKYGTTEKDRMLTYAG